MEKKSKKKNRAIATSPLALAATLAILGAGAFSVSGASAAWSNYSPNGSRWNNDQSQDDNRSNRAVIIGKVTYAGPSHLKIETKNNDYYFDAGAARIIGRDGSSLQVSDIQKDDHLIAYGHFSNGTFFPDFIRDLSRN